MFSKADIEQESSLFEFSVLSELISSFLFRHGAFEVVTVVMPDRINMGQNLVH